MSSIVSSRLDYMNSHPEVQGTFSEVEHELQHLKRREQVSSVVAIVGTVLAMIALAGVMGAGHIIFGALVAIALIAAVYAYFCRQAETSLRSKMMIQQQGETTPLVEKKPTAVASHK